MPQRAQNIFGLIEGIFTKSPGSAHGIMTPEVHCIFPFTNHFSVVRKNPSLFFKVSLLPGRLAEITFDDTHQAVTCSANISDGHLQAQLGDDRAAELSESLQLILDQLEI